MGPGRRFGAVGAAPSDTATGAAGGEPTLGRLGLPSREGPHRGVVATAGVSSAKRTAARGPTPREETRPGREAATVGVVSDARRAVRAGGAAVPDTERTWAGVGASAAAGLCAVPDSTDRGRGSLEQSWSGAQRRSWPVPYGTRKRTARIRWWTAQGALPIRVAAPGPDGGGGVRPPSVGEEAGLEGFSRVGAAGASTPSEGNAGPAFSTGAEGKGGRG